MGWGHTGSIGANWDGMGPYWEHWGHTGVILGGTGANWDGMGPYWEHWGCTGSTGAILGPTGANWGGMGPYWEHWGHTGVILGGTGAVLGGTGLNWAILVALPTPQFLPCPPGCPPALHAVMRRCWARDAAERPSFGVLHRLLRELG